jgi:hypothetical protein
MAGIRNGCLWNFDELIFNGKAVLKKRNTIHEMDTEQ